MPDIREMIPETQPKAPTVATVPGAPKSSGHFVVQVGQIYTAGSRTYEIEATWIRVEMDVPVDIIINDVPYSIGYQEFDNQIAGGEAATWRKYQSPLAWEYTGPIRKLRFDVRFVPGAFDHQSRGLIHVYWSQGNVRVGRGRPTYFVLEDVAPLGWVGQTFVDLHFAANDYLAPAVQDEFGPSEVEVLQIGLLGGLNAGGFELLDARIVWVDPVIGNTVLREFGRAVIPSSVWRPAGPVTFAYQWDFSTPIRIPYFAHLRANAGAAWQLRWLVRSNGIVAPDDLVIATSWRWV